MTVVGRLAPSPTGAQHVGNARTYLIAWLSARSQGGQVRLRIEDIDSPRIKPGAADQALDDLRWLGLDWDGEPIIQTNRLPLYESALRTFASKNSSTLALVRAPTSSARPAPRIWTRKDRSIPELAHIAPPPKQTRLETAPTAGAFVFNGRRHLSTMVYAAPSWRIFISLAAISWSGKHRGRAFRAVPPISWPSSWTMRPRV